MNVGVWSPARYSPVSTAFHPPLNIQEDHIRSTLLFTTPLLATALLVAGCQSSQPAVRADGTDAHLLTGRHVAIMIAPGFHDGETLEPMAYLKDRGARVTIIGLERGEIQAYNSVQKISVEKRIRDVQVADFDALIIPGGRSPATLRENEQAVALARDFVTSGKPVAAICHGPQVLVTAGVMAGRTSTCIENVGPEITAAGGKYIDEPVVRDGNLITSRLPKDLPVFSEAIAQALAG